MKHHFALILLLVLSLFVLNSCNLFAPASTDTEPPVFAGAKALTSFIPDFIYIPEDAWFYLTWEAATDNVTPQDKIIYVVYRNMGPIESFDYGTIYKTTDPGVLSTEVSANIFIDAHFAFAVRASDEACNIDTNTVVLSVEASP